MSVVEENVKEYFKTILRNVSFKSCLVFVGVPLSAGALVYYLLLRKEQEESDTFIHSQYSRVEVSIPADKVGAIIGKEGCVIKEIERNHGVKLNLKLADSENSLVYGDEPRKLIIKGQKLDVSAAELSVRKILSSTPPTLTEVVNIPKCSVGALIGKKGNTIREISRFSNARLTINSADNENVTVTIKGKPHAIESAKILIENKIKDGYEFKKKRNFDVDPWEIESDNSDYEESSGFLSPCSV